MYHKDVAIAYVLNANYYVHRIKPIHDYYYQDSLNPTEILK